jgi:hypothetical protein
MFTSERRLFKTLPPRPRKEILAYIDQPSYKGWVGIRDIIVSQSGQTVAELAVDLKWNTLYPHSLVVARVSKLAEARDRDVEAM